MLKARALHKDDFERVEQLAAQHNFNIDYKHILAYIVIENELGEIVSFALLKRFVEAIFMPDLTCPPRVIVESTKLVMKEADSLKVDIHAFVEANNFAEILEKHFGFQPCVGTALVKIYEDLTTKESQ